MVLDVTMHNGKGSPATSEHELANVTDRGTIDV